MASNPIQTTVLETDIHFLTRELDKAKSSAFIGKNAAFLGSLLCSLKFVWDESVGTAATDGEYIYWAPSYFLKLPPESRKTDLMHELWHVARLHMLRAGNRVHKLWNIACDIKIDQALRNDGYTFEGIQGVLTNPAFDNPAYIDMAEEDIYDDLIKNNVPPPPGSRDDLKPASQAAKASNLNNVVKAIHQAKLGGGAGNIPGDVEQVINQFLAPIVPWEKLLHNFIRDLFEESYTWRKPNRRFGDMYLPSRFLDEGKLEHLAYYEDVSGSITDADCVRFNSEVKYVKETYQPKKMTLVQFDTRITQVIEFEESDPFDSIKIVGRGGTSLVPVRQHILDTKPTAAIIFSDLECEPMQPLGLDIPIIWIAIRSSRTVPFGKKVNIR